MSSCTGTVIRPAPLVPRVTVPPCVSGAPAWKRTSPERAASSASMHCEAIAGGSGSGGVTGSVPASDCGSPPSPPLPPSGVPSPAGGPQATASEQRATRRRRRTMLGTKLEGERGSSVQRPSQLLCHWATSERKVAARAFAQPGTRPIDRRHRGRLVRTTRRGRAQEQRASVKHSQTHRDLLSNRPCRSNSGANFPGGLWAGRSRQIGADRVRDSVPNRHCRERCERIFPSDHDAWSVGPQREIVPRVMAL